MDHRVNSSYYLAVVHVCGVQVVDGPNVKAPGYASVLADLGPQLRGLARFSLINVGLGRMDQQRGESSCFNVLEVHLFVTLVAEIRRQHRTASREAAAAAAGGPGGGGGEAAAPAVTLTIGGILMYKAQLLMLMERYPGMQAAGGGGGNEGDDPADRMVSGGTVDFGDGVTLELGTIDAFQGREKDVIIVGSVWAPRPPPLDQPNKKMRGPSDFVKDAR